MDGELFTAWTIRLSLVAYTVVLLGMLGADWRARRVMFRWIWTLGFLLLLIHVAGAFHFYHDWSHRRAVEQTAADTEALLGWSFGWGVYFNYAFVVVWCVDVTWWWIAAVAYERRHWFISALILGYTFFIAFNGAVVFEDGPTRWFGIGVTVVLVFLLGRRIRESRSRD